MKKRIRDFMTLKADGIGVVEIILILVVLIGLVIIFRDQIQEIVSTLFENISQSIESI